MDVLNEALSNLEKVVICLDSIAEPGELSDELVRIVLPSLRSTLNDIKEDVGTKWQPLLKEVEEKNALLAVKDRELAAKDRELAEKEKQIKLLNDQSLKISDLDLRELDKRVREPNVPAKRGTNVAFRAGNLDPVDEATETTIPGSSGDTAGTSTTRRAIDAARETTTGTPDIGGDSDMFEDDTARTSEDFHMFQDDPSKPTDDDICTKLISEFECPISLNMSVFRTQLLGLVTKQYTGNEGAVREHIDKAAMGPVLGRGKKHKCGLQTMFHRNLGHKQTELQVG
jgi:hypothetical protein